MATAPAYSDDSQTDSDLNVRLDSDLSQLSLNKSTLQSKLKTLSQMSALMKKNLSTQEETNEQSIATFDKLKAALRVLGKNSAIQTLSMATMEQHFLQSQTITKQKELLIHMEDLIEEVKGRLIETLKRLKNLKEEAGLNLDSLDLTGEMKDLERWFEEIEEEEVKSEPDGDISLD